MAITPNATFPTQTNAADADYPLGSARDVTTPGDNTGTPYRASILNDIWGLLQKLLDEASVTASGTPDNVTTSQYYEALRTLFFPLTGPLVAPFRIANSGGDLVSLPTDLFVLITAASTTSFVIQTADVSTAGRVLFLAKTISSVAIIIETQGSELIGNNATMLLSGASDWSGLVLISDGSNWHVLASSGVFDGGASTTT